LANEGGSLPDDTIPEGIKINQIVSNFFSYAAISDDGKVYVWGDLARGGSLPDDRIPEGVKINQIVSNGSSYAAISDDGKVYVWGDPDEGGRAPAGGIPSISLCKFRQSNQKERSVAPASAGGAAPLQGLIIS
jgi:hypothetical protein